MTLDSGEVPCPTPETPRAPLTDVELFELNAEISSDDRGRITGSDGLTIAVARAGSRFFGGSKFSDDIARELRAAYEAHLPEGDPTVEPEALRACAKILEARVGPTRRSRGPYYVIPHGCSFESDAHIETSLGEVSPVVRRGNPGNWEVEEWDDLLDDRLHGSWAMAIVADRVVSICHTPIAMSAEAAECGAWTDPEFRGRGYAAATVAAWAAILQPTGRQLFYSTQAENLSSQRVAERLGLRLIGWTWNLEMAGAT